MSSPSFSADADKIAECCQSFYEATMPKRNRPASDECTNMAAILACIVETTTSSGRLRVLSMATGTKCLPEKSLSTNGTLIHDSHAEVLARRGFVRFCYLEFDKLLCNEKSEIFELNNGADDESTAKLKLTSKRCDDDIHRRIKAFKVKETVKFYFYSSHTPCGDASIIPKEVEEGEANVGIKRNTPSNDDEDGSNVGCQATSKKLKTNVGDIHRTGAKCLPNSLCKDPKRDGVEYHITGVSRTKPGRGDPTKSMSCSDKMAKWIVLGIQGSLLTLFLDKPIYIDKIIIGRCPFDLKCIQRALLDRSKQIETLTLGYSVSMPLISQVSHQMNPFQDSKLARLEILADNVIKSSPTSLCWISGLKEGKVLVLVNGTYQGVTKRSLKKIKPEISKSKFFDLFKHTLDRLAAQRLSSSELQAASKSLLSDKFSYSDCKDLARHVHGKNASEFHRVYQDWIFVDKRKHYNFS